MLEHKWDRKGGDRDTYANVLVRQHNYSKGPSPYPLCTDPGDTDASMGNINWNKVSLCTNTEPISLLLFPRYSL